MTHQRPHSPPSAASGGESERSASKGPLVIAVANQKGGVGKTTTTLNLAVYLALAGRRCLLIDIDPQANATSGLGIEVRSRGGAHHALLHPERTPETIRSSSIDGLDVLGSNTELQGIERDLLASPDREKRLSSVLKAIQAPYQYILIDCPPSLGLFPANAFNCCDGVLIPIQCEYYAMEGLAQVLAGVEKAQRANARLHVLGILLTMFDPACELAHEVADEVRGHFPDQVYRSVIPRDVALSEAPSHSQSIFEYAPRSRGALAYLELAREVIAQEDNTRNPAQRTSHGEE